MKRRETLRGEKQRHSETAAPPPQAANRHSSLLHLQQTTGNQSALQLLGLRDAEDTSQQALTINTPGDANEGEADRVAEQVMRMEGNARRCISRYAGSEIVAGEPVRRTGR